MHVRTRPALAATVLMLSACTAAGEDRAGNDTRVLRMASIDKIDNNGYSFGPATFVDQVPTVSGGRLQVEVEQDYDGGSPEAEANLIRDVSSGELDGGWAATRAFAEAGIDGLRAFEAPFVLTGYRSQAAVAEGDAATLALSHLDETDVVGLAITAGPLRRPFSAGRPLLGVEDWTDVRFRVTSGADGVQARAVDALGARVSRDAAGLRGQWAAAAAAGDLDGAEFDLQQYLANGYAQQAGNVPRNLVLWPKMYVLILNRDLWDSLDDDQQGWMREAAEAAVAASVNGDYEDDEVATRLCERGVRFHDASPADLLGLRAAVAPVLEELAADPVEGPVLAEIREAAEQDSTPETPTVPESCMVGFSLPVETSEPPTTMAPVPDGTYRKQITTEEVEMAGLSNNDGISGTWTLSIRAGTYELRCRPISDPGTDCGHSTTTDVLDAGVLRGDGDDVWWVYEASRLAEATGCRLPASTESGHCVGPIDPVHLRWSQVGDDLVLSEPPGFAGEKSLKTWVRIS